MPAERLRRPSSENADLSRVLKRVTDELASLRDLVNVSGDRFQHICEPDPGLQPHCVLKPVPQRALDPDVSLFRERLIRTMEKKWNNGTTLHYAFFPSGDWSAADDQKNLVREGFDVWKRVGIGITFKEVESVSEAEVRIGFLIGDGSWSYIGRDILSIPGQGERTMNFGWDLTQDPRRENVAVHEIGHTLGFPHEHQNPFAGIVWNEDEVYRYFSGPPNQWSRETIRFNILSKELVSEVEGSQWDPDSIMEYAFPPGLVREPQA